MTSEHVLSELMDTSIGKVTVHTDDCPGCEKDLPIDDYEPEEKPFREDEFDSRTCRNCSSINMVFDSYQKLYKCMVCSWEPGMPTKIEREAAVAIGQQYETTGYERDLPEEAKVSMEARPPTRIFDDPVFHTVAIEMWHTGFTGIGWVGTEPVRYVFEIVYRKAMTRNASNRGMMVEEVVFDLGKTPIPLGKVFWEIVRDRFKAETGYALGGLWAWIDENLKG